MLKKQKSQKHKLKKLKSMEKVKIKRVKKVKKHIGAKEKTLAALGVGGSLLGAIGAVTPKPPQTQFVRNVKTDASSSSSKIKQTLKNVFGIKSAKAFGEEELPAGGETPNEENPTIETPTPPPAPVMENEEPAGGSSQEVAEPAVVEPSVPSEPETVSSPESSGGSSQETPPDSGNLSAPPVNQVPQENAVDGLPQMPNNNSFNPTADNNSADNNFFSPAPISFSPSNKPADQAPPPGPASAQIGLNAATQTPTSDNQIPPTQATVYDVFLTDTGRRAYGGAEYGLVTIRPDGTAVSETGLPVPQAILNGINSSLNVVDHRTNLPSAPHGGISPTLISNLSTVPFGQLSAGDIALFQNYFMSGANTASIPSSFSRDSAFAFGLNLGNAQVGDDAWVGNRRFVLNNNGQWVIATTQPADPSPPPPPPPPSAQGPRIGEIRVVNRNGQQVGQTFDGATWRDMGWQPPATPPPPPPPPAGSRTPADLGLRPTQGSTAVVDGVEFEAKEEGTGFVWVKTGDIIQTPISQTGSVNLSVSNGTAVGSQWRLVIRGTPGQRVFATGGRLGADNRQQLGVIGANGQLVLTGTFSENDIGTWQQNYYFVGANNAQVLAGEATFTVVPVLGGGGGGAGGGGGSTVTGNATLTVVNGTLNGAGVGQDWRLVIRGNPGEQVFAVGGVNGANDRHPLGTIGANGELVLTGTFTADVVGNWQQRYTTVRNNTDVTLGTANFIVNTTPVVSPQRFTYLNPAEVLKVHTETGNWRAPTAGEVGTNTHAFATYETAVAVAKLMGGQVVVVQNYNRSQPEYAISLPGESDVFSAGLIAHNIEMYGLDYAKASLNAEAIISRSGTPAMVAPATGDMARDTQATAPTFPGAVSPGVTGAGGGVASGTVRIGANLGNNPATTAQNKQVSVSSVNVLNLQNQNAGQNLRSGYKVEISGTHLNVYNRFELVIGSHAVVIANPVITQNKITLTIPANIPSGVLNNSSARIRIVSGMPGVTDGLLDSVFIFQLTPGATTSSDGGGEGGGGNLSSGNINVPLGTRPGNTGADNVIQVLYVSGRVSSGSEATDTVRPGNIIEIGGYNLDVYKRAELISGSKIFPVTHAVFAQNKITITVPDLDTQLAAGAEIKIKLISETPSVPSVVLSQVLFYNLKAGTASIHSQNSVTGSTLGTTAVQTQNGTEVVAALANANNNLGTGGGSGVLNAGNTTGGNTTIMTGNQSVLSSGNIGTQNASSGNKVQTAGASVGQVRSFATADQMAGGLKYQSPGLQMPPGYAANSQVLPAATPTPAKIIYPVKKGDTLWSIAKKYYGEGKHWRKILSANPNCLSQAGNTKTLKIGFELQIP